MSWDAVSRWSGVSCKLVMMSWRGLNDLVGSLGDDGV